MDLEKAQSLLELRSHLKGDKNVRENGAVQLLRKSHCTQIDALVKPFLLLAEDQSPTYFYHELHGKRSVLIHPKENENIVVRLSSEFQTEERRPYHEDVQQPLLARVIKSKKAQELLVEVMVNSVDYRIGKDGKTAIGLSSNIDPAHVTPEMVRSMNRMIRDVIVPKHAAQGMGDLFDLSQGVMQIDISESGVASVSIKMLDGHELKIKDPALYAKYLEGTGLNTLAEQHGRLSATFSHLEKYLSQSARTAIDSARR